MERCNAVVATGTASGKTESFLYPILFELYRQHLAGELQSPGVRAMILYPMNALANDQRERLGRICEALHDGGSTFRAQIWSVHRPDARKTARTDGVMPPRERRIAYMAKWSSARRCATIHHTSC